MPTGAPAGGMKGFWRVGCPICRRDRQTRIPEGADTRTVTADYDRHANTHKESKG